MLTEELNRLLTRHFSSSNSLSMIASGLRIVSSEQVVTDALAEPNHVQFGKNIGSAV